MFFYDNIKRLIYRLLVGLSMRIGNLVIKLVKRYWNEGDLWEVFVKNNRSVGFLRKTITKYYDAAWSVLLRYSKDVVEFKTKREAVEYLVDSEE